MCPCHNVMRKAFCFHVFPIMKATSDKPRWRESLLPACSEPSKSPSTSTTTTTMVAAAATTTTKERWRHCHWLTLRDVPTGYHVTSHPASQNWRHCWRRPTECGTRAVCLCCVSVEINTPWWHKSLATVETVMDARKCLLFLQFLCNSKITVK